MTPPAFVQELCDRSRFLVALAKDPHALRDSAYANDKKFLLAAIETCCRQQCGVLLQLASASLRNDTDLVRAVAGKEGSALRFASLRVRDDKDVVLATVANHGYALKYASTTLRNDKEVVLAAVGSDGYALTYASSELKSDRQVILLAASDQAGALYDAMPEALDCSRKENLDFVCTILQSSMDIKRYYNDANAVVCFFPHLQEVLCNLHQKLQVCESFSRLVDESDVQPHVFADQWHARLHETRNCLRNACKNRNVPAGAEDIMLQYTELARDTLTANMLESYSPLLCELVKLQTVPFVDSWWGVLKRLA